MTTGQLLVVGLLLPMAGFLVNRFYGPTNRALVQIVGPGAVGLSFLAFVLVALMTGGGEGDHVVYRWLEASSGSPPGVVPSVDVSLYFDALAALMTLVITGVGFL